jgi:hypothetical protein
MGLIAIFQYMNISDWNHYKDVEIVGLVRAAFIFKGALWA